MKKNKLMRLASGLVIAVLLTTCAISGTLAKYTSTATGSDSASVAKWSIKVGTTEIANATAQNISFDLFKTINDSNGTDAETDVATSPVTHLIAPGTSGSFDLSVKNESEVNAKYSLSFNVTNEKNIPIEYSTDGITWNTDLSTLNISDKDINMGATAADTTTVQWRWVYSVNDAGDATDTALGIEAQGTAPSIKIEATVIATQVD